MSALVHFHHIASHFVLRVPVASCSIYVLLAWRVRTRYGIFMVGIVAGLWGLFGGFAVEGLEFYAALRRHRRCPWQLPDPTNPGAVPVPGPWFYIVAEIIRLLVGAGLAWASAATGQISGPLGALGVGAAAPTIIGQITKAIPLSTASEPRRDYNPPTMVHPEPGGNVPSTIPVPRRDSAVRALKAPDAGGNPIISAMEPDTGAMFGE